MFYFVPFIKYRDRHKNVNYLTAKEFFDIKINGVRLGAISATKGDRDQMKQLFGNHIEIIEKDDMISEWMISFLDRAKGLGITFINNRPDSKKDYILYSFSVWLSSKITIKGVTVGVGNPVRKLGNVKFISNNIYFNIRDASGTALIIEFHPYFKTILSIQYTTYT